MTINQLIATCFQLAVSVILFHFAYIAERRDVSIGFAGVGGYFVGLALLPYEKPLRQWIVRKLKGDS